MTPIFSRLAVKTPWSMLQQGRSLVLKLITFSFFFSCVNLCFLFDFWKPKCFALPACQNWWTVQFRSSTIPLWQNLSCSIFQTLSAESPVGCMPGNVGICSKEEKNISLDNNGTLYYLWLAIVSKAVSWNIAVSCFHEQAPAWHSPV